MTRIIPDIKPKQTKIILITDFLSEKDIQKGKILSSSEGVSYNQTLKKSKFKNYIYYTYLDTDFTNTYLFEIFREITKIDKSYALDELYAKSIKIVFAGQKVFDNFMSIYRSSGFNSRLFINQNNKVIRISSLFQNYIEIPYYIINSVEDALINSKNLEIMEQLDLIYAGISEKSVESITNADYISIDQFINHLDTLKNLYLNKKIEYVAFDIETNTAEWAESWSKICLVSIADKYTKMAYSCAQFHPEIWMSPFREEFWDNLWPYLNSIYNKENNSDIILESKNLVEKIKQFRLDLTDRFEVNSWFEDNLLDNLILLGKDLSLKGTKSKEIDLFNLKKQKILDFANENKELISKIKDLDKNISFIESEIDRLWMKLDEVLSIIPIVGQNIKFDVGFLYSKNIARDKIHIVGDTLGEACMLTRTVDDKGLKIDLDLESLYERETGKQNSWKSKFKSSNRLKVLKLGTRFDNVELENLGIYSALDSYCTLELHELFMEKLKERIKIDGSNKAETFLMEQYKALEKFSSGEIYYWSPDQYITELLYKKAILDTETSFNNILELPVVKQFLLDNPSQETFKINTSGAQSHKAKILFDKRYFALEPVEAGKSGFPSTDTDKVLKPILKAAKETLRDNKEIFEYNLAEKGKKFSIKVNEEYREKILKNIILFIEALLNYAEWQKLKTGYIDTIWDNDKKVSLKYRANFKIINATYSMRLSSGMHTIPKPNSTNLRDTYCSIWNSNSNRLTESEHKIGKEYNPDHGLVEVEYEDGTKEITTYKELEKQGLV